MARKSRKGQSRQAAVCLALFGGAVLATSLFSCLSSDARSGGDGSRTGPIVSLGAGGPSPTAALAIPRDLAGAPPVRVALSTKAREISIEVRGPYAIYATEDARGRPQFEGDSLPPTSMHAEGDGIIFVTWVFRPGVLRIVPKNPATLVVDGTWYRGELVCRARAGIGATQAGTVAALGRDFPSGVIAVNVVNLEEYTAGVVGAEMPLLFPEAALRAQAIASRTYGLYQTQTHGSGALWDVSDDVGSQVYRGLAKEGDRARAVVNDTLGVVLTWRGALIPAYFHSTCGGATVPAKFALGGEDCGPLDGATCGFCGDSPHSKWELSITKSDVAERLRREGTPIAAVEVVEVIEEGPAGHAGAVRISGAGKVIKIAAPRFRMIVGPGALKSTRFTIEDRGDRLIFRGTGWGHGVGLCQYGARGMATAGHDASAILHRYYPGADLAKLYGSP